MKPLRLPLVALLCGFLLAACTNGVEESPSLSMTAETRGALAVLPAEAQVVGMADYQALRENPLFDPAGGALAGGNAEASARLRQMIEATGFEPAKDLRQVYVALTEDGPQIAAYATLQPDRMTTFLDQQPGLQHTQHGGRRIYHAAAPSEAGRKGGESWFAVASENLIVASTSQEGVQRMLDRVSTGAGALSENAPLMQLVEQAAGDAWMAGFVTDAMKGEAPAKDRQAAVLARSVRSFVTSLSATPTGFEGRAAFEAAPGVDPADLEDLVRGAVAAMKAEPSAERLEMLDAVQVARKGDQVTVRMEATNAQLSALK